VVVVELGFEGWIGVCYYVGQGTKDFDGFVKYYHSWFQCSPEHRCYRVGREKRQERQCDLKKINLSPSGLFDAISLSLRLQKKYLVRAALMCMNYSSLRSQAADTSLCSSYWGCADPWKKQQALLLLPPLCEGHLCGWEGHGQLFFNWCESEGIWGFLSCRFSWNVTVCHWRHGHTHTHTHSPSRAACFIKNPVPSQMERHDHLVH
jgi:hypothetical protein